ncbi:hypothetical protein PR048_007800 [Dryococelus australis]|uniref:Uncharacterized protein n=1 Tax=Dryococelus australis TaxID=614101 RepID=A0ABQ9HV97_9NEOP|nr:hypothetical protein PR048_007800 [Dryococelus australis]
MVPTPKLGGHGGVVVRLLTSHRGEPGSIPGGIAPGFSQVGFVQDDAAGRRVFFRGSPDSTSLSFRRCSILTSFHPSVAAIGTLAAQTPVSSNPPLPTRESDQVGLCLADMRALQSSAGVFLLVTSAKMDITRSLLCRPPGMGVSTGRRARDKTGLNDDGRGENGCVTRVQEMRRIEVRMEQRRNKITGETEYPRKKPAASGIVWHDSNMRKSGSDQADSNNNNMQTTTDLTERSHSYLQENSSARQQGANITVIRESTESNSDVAHAVVNSGDVHKTCSECLQVCDDYKTTHYMRIQASLKISRRSHLIGRAKPPFRRMRQFAACVDCGKFGNAVYEAALLPDLAATTPPPAGPRDPGVVTMAATQTWRGGNDLRAAPPSLPGMPPAVPMSCRHLSDSARPSSTVSNVLTARRQDIFTFLKRTVYGNIFCEIIVYEQTRTPMFPVPWQASILNIESGNYVMDEHTPIQDDGIPPLKAFFPAVRRFSGRFLHRPFVSQLASYVTNLKQTGNSERHKPCTATKARKDGVTTECKVGVNGNTQRKPACQRQRTLRSPLARFALLVGDYSDQDTATAPVGMWRSNALQVELQQYFRNVGSNREWAIVVTSLPSLYQVVRTSKCIGGDGPTRHHELAAAEEDVQTDLQNSGSHMTETKLCAASEIGLPHLRSMVPSSSQAAPSLTLDVTGREASSPTLAGSNGRAWVCTPGARLMTYSPGGRRGSRLSSGEAR